MLELNPLALENKNIKLCKSEPECVTTVKVEERL